MVFMFRFGFSSRDIMDVYIERNPVAFRFYDPEIVHPGFFPGLTQRYVMRRRLPIGMAACLKPPVQLTMMR
jgi:hypothetical protein